MSWIVENWQLKLLAGVLSFGLFVAVAFQQNPVVTRLIKDVPVSYENAPSDVELINAPGRQNVTVYGLASSVNNVTQTNLQVKVDLSRVRPGLHVLTASVRALVPGVSVTSDHVNFSASIEDRVTKQISVEARTTPAPGWQVTKATVTVTTPSNQNSGAVTVAAPRGFFDGLTAYVTFGPVSANATVPNLPIHYERAGKEVQLPNNVVPVPTADAVTAALSIEASKPKQTINVPVVETPSGTPASGYRITAVTISPLFIDVSGSADDLSKIDSVILPAIAVDGATQTITRAVRVSTLPPNTSSSIAQVTVTITIQRNPATSPSPGP
jgi:YbbR domain-containing protein